MGEGATDNSPVRQVTTRRKDPTLTAMVDDIVPQLENLLGVSLQSEVEIIRVNSAAEIGRDAELNVAAFPFGARSEIVNRLGLNLADFGLNSIDSCWILVNEGTISRSFDSFEPKTKEMALAHELMHCFQYELAPSGLPGWVMEGSAAWAGEAFVNGTDYYEDYAWQIYDIPRYGLFGSNPYSAIGLWSHVDNVLNGGLFGLLPNIYSSGLQGEDMLSAVINQIGTDGYATWSSGVAGRPEWGPEWESIGVGGRRIQKVPTAATESEGAIFGQIRLFSVQRVASAAESLILEIETDGLGLMHWSESGGSIEFGQSQPDQYCWSGDCVCDDGTPPSGFETLVDAPDSEDLVVAMSGNADKTMSTFTSRFIKVSELCPEVLPPLVDLTPSGGDSCLVGRWKLDLDYVERQVKANLRASDPQNEDLDIGDLTGQITVDFRADGTATGLVDITLRSETPESPADEEDIEITTTVEGNANFEWSTNDRRYTVSYTDDVVFEVSAVATLGDIVVPLTQSNELFTREQLFGATGGGGVRYDCTDNVSLVFFGDGENSVDARYTPIP